MIFSPTGLAVTEAEKEKITAFLSQQFQQQPIKSHRLWLTPTLKKQIKAILKRPTKHTNYRYWQTMGKTIWILNEVGKERDITTAITIKNQQVEQVTILIYRESRGAEVRALWFTEQFKGSKYRQAWQTKIDSISGATLSVNALKKQVALALFLNQNIKHPQTPE